MTPEVIEKLEQAYLAGCNDLQACLYAGIGDRTLDDYEAKNPDFARRKRALRDNLKLQAKLNIQRAIEKDKNLSLSQWLLERREREEYGNKEGMNLTINVPQITYGKLESQVPKEVTDGTAGNPQDIPRTPVEGSGS